MTYRSLYRLEARGLLDCPIVGVAFDDWTLEQLVERAHDSIVATGEPLDDEIFGRLAKRLSYIHGDFSDAGTYQAGREGDRGRDPPGLLPRDPALALRHRRRRARQGRPHEERAGRRREAVRARPRLRACAQRRAARTHRGVAAVPDRPLSRESCPSRTSSTSASRTRSWSRSGTGSSCRASRSRWARTSASRTAATSTTRWAPCATSSRTTSSRS